MTVEALRNNNDKTYNGFSASWKSKGDERYQ